MVSGQPHVPADAAPPVSVTGTSAVATITMRTPALTTAGKQALLDAVLAAAGDASVRAIVLTGTGRVFCAGQDLTEHAAALREDPATAFATLTQHYNPLVTALTSAPNRWWPRSTVPARAPGYPWRSPVTCACAPTPRNSPPPSPASGSVPIPGCRRPWPGPSAVPGPAS